MKKFFTLGCLVVLLSIKSNAQALLTENFAYTAGDALTANGWTQIGTTATNPISVTNPGLTYTGYTGSGVGNAATLTTTGQDIYRDAPSSIASGNVYVSFLLNVTTAQATGDYFFALLPTTSTSNYTARTFIKSSGAGFQIGVSKSTEAVTYAPLTYTFGTTYLIVVKYNFATTTTTDDQISLYVFDSGVPATEPGSPTAGPTAGTATDAASLGRIALRQGTAANAPGLTIDAIRVADTWSNAPLPVKLNTFNGGIENNKASLWWSTTNEINFNKFIIERSNDAINFINAGEIIAKNTTGINNYQFTDNTPLSGNTWYRLRMVDKDGSVRYSQLIALRSKSGIKLNAYPNPVINILGIAYEKATKGTIAKIINLDGKVIISQSLQEGSTVSSLNVANLTRGNYLIVVENGTDKQTAKFVKQ